MTRNAIITALILLLCVGTASAQGDVFVTGHLRYMVTGSSTVSVSAEDDKISGNVAIPVTVLHNDTAYTVSAIATKGFAECKGIQSIVLPAKISKIGKAAFQNCANLNTINIPYSVKEIKAETFEGCRFLTGITVPDGVRSIGDRAFRGCDRLTRFIMPDECQSIGDEVFSGCAKLQVVAFGAKMETIGQNVFQGCTEIVRFQVDKDNPFFECYNEALIWKKGKGESVFLKYPPKKRDAMYEMPAHITEIGGYAFENVEDLVLIKVNNGCHTIQNYAFFSCMKLERIAYPHSLRLLGEVAAFGCPMILDDNNIPGGVMYIEER